MNEALVFGEFDLLMDQQSPADYHVLAMGEEASWGSPEPITRVVQSLLQDGAKVVTESHGNREAVLRVLISAEDPIALADAEDALFAEVGRGTNTLTWTPPGEVSVPTVFEVIASRLDPEYDNAQEAIGQRTYRLTLTCAPWTRSVSPTVTEAVDDGTTPAPDPVVLDDGSDATPWSCDYGLVVSDGSRIAPETQPLGVVPSPANGDYVTLTREFSVAVDLATRPFISVDIDYRMRGPVVFRLYVDGTTVPTTRVAVDANASGGVTYTWKVDSDITSASTLGIGYKEFNSSGSKTRRMFLDNLTASNVTPLSGSNRQKVRSFDVGGSARTPGALSIAHPTDSLLSTLVYTWPDDGSGYSPPTRRWRTAGQVATSDAAAVSGATNELNQPSTYTIPVAHLPAGVYMPTVFAGSAISGSWEFTLEASLQLGGVDVGAPVSITATRTFPNPGNPGIQELGLLTLPPTWTPRGSDADVRITLSVTSGGADLDLDELWLFNVSAGRLSRVNAVPEKRLWLETPSLTTQRYVVMVGDSEDQSDAYHMRPEALARHEFTPGRMNVFTMTKGAENPAVAFSHYERWHTHARR